MKPLISFMLIVITALFAATAMAQMESASTSTTTAADATTKTKVVYVCPKKHVKHHKKYHRYVKYDYYYAPGYFRKTCCNGCVRESYCPGYYYRCETNYSYHSGRNSAKVQTCY